MNQTQNQLFDGMDIFDWEGVKVGKVVRYDAKLGYFETEGTFSGPRYVPVSAIYDVGPSGAHLNVDHTTVKEQYKHMPKVSPGISASGKLSGGGRVASGYTGQPVPLDAEGIQLVLEKITKGAKVFDSEGKKLGTIQLYDKKTGYMRIQKGELVLKDIFLPVTAVSYLDDTGIHLSLTKDVIMNRFEAMPQVAQAFFTS